MERHLLPIGFSRVLVAQIEGPRGVDTRPETEYLVEWAIEISESQHCSSLLDMGTGSGAIALAMKSACPQLEVTATDESTGALAVAHENAEALGLDIELTESDWFRGIAGRVWSLIVSNPPYIAASDPHLTAGDLRFEPQNALTDGDMASLPFEPLLMLHPNIWR